MSRFTLAGVAALVFVLGGTPEKELGEWAAHFAEGREAMRTGDTMAARAAFSEALQIARNPDEREGTLRELARVSADLGDLHAALDLYGELIRALALRPGQEHEQSLAHSARARVLERLGDSDGALSDLTSALELTRRFVPRGILVAGAEMEIAHHFETRGVLAEAELHVKRALEALEGTASHRMEARVWEDYAKLLDLLGRADEGARARERASQSHRLADATQLPIRILSPENDFVR